jgi:DNA-binding IclR family transcriptional regulator
MLDVLDLFKPGTPAVDIEAICAQLDYAPASAYRYVRELCDVGLLVRLPGGYALGPRIIELDLQMREEDPLLNSSRAAMQQLAEETGLSVLLSELYGDTVINVHQEQGRDSEPLRFGRGRPMALFRSATARVILAHLPSRHLRRVYDDNAEHPDVQRLGEHWKAFAKAMLDTRKRGYSVSEGDLDNGKAGIAAPIFDGKRVIGSITAVGAFDRFHAFNETYLAAQLVGIAQDITQRIGAGR